ncbi:hypothetical protein P3C24_26700 [Pseudomonas proteolytica]|uniref:hypothetical protein n=1 Tax=Pseudomonas proteolytica TaxID=219574 RepID=UPI0023DF1DBB|nr:hypothetical protein [Pseudomonas proteolytica]MDF3164528.1 hypothetical protein [Pseudomonas proteolytica]
MNKMLVAATLIAVMPTLSYAVDTYKPMSQRDKSNAAPEVLLQPEMEPNATTVTEPTRATRPSGPQIKSANNSKLYNEVEPQETTVFEPAKETRGLRKTD